MVSELIIIFVLILINGALSMSEIAIMQSKRIRLEGLVKKGSASAAKALALHNEPTRFLSTVQIGITLVSILTGIYSGGMLSEFLELQFSAFPLFAPYAHSIAVGIVVVAVTYFSLVFGELVPKRLGMSKPETIASWMAQPMVIIQTVTKPFIWLLSASTNLIVRLMGIKAGDTNTVTEEELRAAIDEGASHGAIDKIESDIMGRVMLLGDKRINSLMTSRHDLAWLDLEDPIEETLIKAAKLRHSYFPLCEGSLDDIVGVLSIKDLFNTQTNKNNTDLRAMAIPPVYFPESMRGYQALEKFQKERSHFALVIDEYGTVVGLVTLTDIFDAIVGDIRQEDGESIGYSLIEREDGSFLVDGQYPWIDLLEKFEIEDTNYLKDGYHTVAGFILHTLEEVPHEGQKVRWGEYWFEVIDMDGPRVDKLLMAPHNEDYHRVVEIEENNDNPRTEEAEL